MENSSSNDSDNNNENKNDNIDKVNEISNNNNTLIKKILTSINLNPFNSSAFSRKVTDSLYNLFHNKNFNIDSLIFYITKQQNQCIIDELVNLIYTKYQNDSFFYILQLCSLLTYKKYIKSIENYLLDSCVNRMKFSLIIFWMTFANPCKKLDSLQQSIEITMVNNKRYSKIKSEFYISDNIKDNDEIIKEGINKGVKLDYFNYVVEFYENISKLSDYLFKTEVVNRDFKLKEKLEEYNSNIKEMKKVISYNNDEDNDIVNLFYSGILLPFNDNENTSNEYCNIIVSFIPELSQCYNSKSRVPIKLTVECVRLYEIKKNFNLIRDSKQYLIENLANDILLNGNNINEEKNSELNNFFGKKYSDIIKEQKQKSIYSDYDTYTLKTFIYKANDDLRQEFLTLQLIKKFDMIFKSAKIPIHLFPYEIIVTSENSGIIEFIPDTLSIDQIKKKLSPKKNLNDFFREFFKENLETAQKNFCESLAGYSLICYFLDIRDRHNGNILIDINGNIIHIDFGFILGIGPGGMDFEKAPFKLTKEYVEILDGENSGMYQYFKSLLLLGFNEARKFFDVFWNIIEITYNGNKNFTCFKGANLNVIKNKFYNKFRFSEVDINIGNFSEVLVKESYENWRTKKYDQFQSMSNNISE